MLIGSLIFSVAILKSKYFIHIAKLVTVFDQVFAFLLSPALHEIIVADKICG